MKELSIIKELSRINRKFIFSFKKIFLLLKLCIAIERNIKIEDIEKADGRKNIPILNRIRSFENILDNN